MILNVVQGAKSIPIFLETTNDLGIDLAPWNIEGEEILQLFFIIFMDLKYLTDVLQRQGLVVFTSH